MFPADTYILIAEDSATTREELWQELNNIGYNRILEAQDGFEAYDRLVSYFESGIEIGLVISDWKMPRLNGLDLLKRIRSNPALTHLPVIMLTSVREAGDVMEAISQGASDYILKPFKPGIVEKKLSDVWKKRKLPAKPPKKI